MQRMTAVVMVACFMFSSLIAISQQALSPILIVPGLRGSRLQAKMDRYQDRLECGDLLDVWKTYWVDLVASFKCIKNILSLQYDEKARKYSNITGFHVKAVDLKSIESVEYLDEARLIEYFHPMVRYFVLKGYTRNRNIRAAPFDWRLAPASLFNQGYYADVQSMIEQMYAREGNTRVTIVAHSMGGPVSLYFLNKMDQTWKDKYIHAYIPLSGAWSGGNRGLLAFASQIEIDANWYVRQFASTFPTMESAVWLLPDPDVWQDTVIVTTNNKTLNYTAKQYKQMLTLRDYYRWTNATFNNGKLKAPNVATHCFYGTASSAASTPEVFHYGYGYPKQQAYQSTTNGPGDTIVNLRDSQVCLQWKTQQSYPFYSQSFPFTHMQMVNEQQIFQAIHAVVTTLASPTQPTGPHVGVGQPPSQPNSPWMYSPRQILKSFMEKVTIGYHKTVRKFTTGSRND